MTPEQIKELAIKHGAVYPTPFNNMLQIGVRCFQAYTDEALALTPSQEVLDGYVKSVLGAPVGALWENTQFSEGEITGHYIGEDKVRPSFIKLTYLYTLKPAVDEAASFEKTSHSFRIPLVDESNKCWCATCDLKNNPYRTRMSICPECGDKRCPRAELHINKCTKPADESET